MKENGSSIKKRLPYGNLGNEIVLVSVEQEIWNVYSYSGCSLDPISA